MSNHICDNTQLIIQVTGHGHDNPKKQPQQLMFYKDNYKTPQQNIKSQEGITKLQEDNYPSRYECPSILFEYPECDAKDTQLAIKIPKQNGGDIILPLLDKVVGGTTDKDNTQVYKSHRIWAIVPMTKIHVPSEIETLKYGGNREEYNTFKSTCALAREGYFYIFNNGKLWREIKIIQQGEETYYQDIDLAADKEKQAPREPSGVKLNNIWIPAAFPNTSLEIQFAYSEDQWSKERIAYLEKNEMARLARCDTIKDNTTITQPIVKQEVFVPENNAPFQLTKLLPIRARNFEEELMLDNPNGYLKSLSKDYLKDVLEINHNTFSRINDKNTYTDLYSDDRELSAITDYQFDMSAWVSLIYQKDPTNNEELKNIAEFWPKATKYNTYQSGKLPELTDLSAPTQKVSNALENHQKQYILGMLVTDDIYTLHQSTSRVSVAILLLEKLEALAAKRPLHYLASLVNVQRKYFTNIDDALNTVSHTVKHNFYYSLAELERKTVVRLISQAQALIYKTLTKSRTRQAIADLLSNHNPIDYAGHMYFILTALNAVAAPEYSFDPQTRFTQKGLTQGQQLIQSIVEGKLNYQDFTYMLQTAKVNEQILKELDDYFTTSTEPTDNKGDGAFRLSVLNALNQELKANKTFKARSYNGNSIAELIDKIDKKTGQQEHREKINENVYSGGLSTLKGLSSFLMGIATNLQNAALQIEIKEQNFRNLKNQRKPVTTRQRQTTGVDAPQARTNNVQKYHAAMYYNLREIMPDTFKDLRFVPISRALLVGDYIVSVDEAIRRVTQLNSGMGGAIPAMEYDTSVRMVQVKATSQLEAFFKELDSDLKSSQWVTAYTEASEQIWTENIQPSYKSKSASWLAENKERLLATTDSQQKITNRMMHNMVQKDLSKGNVVDYGKGTLHDMIDNRLSFAEAQSPEKLKKVREGYDLATKTYLQKVEVAASVGKTSFAEKVNKLLNSKILATVFLGMEIYNIKTFNEQKESIQQSQGKARVIAGGFSATIDTISTTFFLMERVSFINQGNKLTDALDKKLIAKLSGRMLLSSVGVGLGIGLSLDDAFYEMIQGHTGRMALNIVAAAGLSLMFFSGNAGAGTILLGLGPVGLFGLAVMIMATIALITIQTTDLEDWLQQGPFADFTAQMMPAAKGWLVIPEEAYYRFISLLSGINVHAEKYTPKRIAQADSEFSEEIQKKINQANIKVTLTSNLPGLINMKLNPEDTQIYFQAFHDPGMFDYYRYPKYTKLHEQETTNGREIYLYVDNQSLPIYKQGKTGLKVAVQIRASLTYFNTKMDCRFPAPAPKDDTLWDDKLYGKPNFDKENTPFWHIQTLSDIL